MTVAINDDDRRVRLLLKYELDYPGMTVTALVNLALDQSIREPRIVCRQGCLS